jgi:hypothetical protein
VCVSKASYTSSLRPHTPQHSARRAGGSSMVARRAASVGWISARIAMLSARAQRTCVRLGSEETTYTLLPPHQHHHLQSQITCRSSANWRHLSSCSRRKASYISNLRSHTRILRSRTWVRAADGVHDVSEVVAEAPGDGEIPECIRYCHCYFVV